MASILQDWVAGLGLRHQGVLLTAVRGCDTAHRDDVVKLLSKAIRAETLVPFCGDLYRSAAFMHYYSDDDLRKHFATFRRAFGHHPLHYVRHLILAVQVVGYYHPARSELWREFYFSMCRKMRMSPESKEDMDARLNMDEEEFRRLME